MNNINDKKVLNLNSEKVFRYTFLLVLSYLFLEYGRPQTYIPPLRLIRPGMILTLLIIISLFREGQLFHLLNVQTKLFIALILLMTIHVPIASNNFHAFQQWRGLIILFIIYMSILNFVNTYERIIIYIDTWIFINVFGAIMGAMSGGRIYNAYFMSDENDFSLVMNMLLYY